LHTQNLSTEKGIQTFADSMPGPPGFVFGYAHEMEAVLAMRVNLAT